MTTFNATAPVSDIPRPTSLPPGTCLALHVPSQWPRAPCGPKCPREETTSKRHVGTPTNVSGDSSPSPLPGRSICMFKRARRPSQACFLYAMPCETCAVSAGAGRFCLTDCCEVRMFWKRRPRGPWQEHRGTVPRCCRHSPRFHLFQNIRSSQQSLRQNLVAESQARTDLLATASTAPCNTDKNKENTS